MAHETLPLGSYCERRMGSLGISTGFAHSVALQNADLLECHGLIGGAWVAAHNDKTFPVHDPSTGKVLGLVGDFGEDDFIRAIRSAEVAYRQFSRNTTAKEELSCCKGGSS